MISLIIACVASLEMCGLIFVVFLMEYIELYVVIMFICK